MPPIAIAHLAVLLFQLRDFLAGGAVLRKRVEVEESLEVRMRRGARRVVDLSIMWGIQKEI